MRLWPLLILIWCTSLTAITDYTPKGKEFKTPVRKLSIIVTPEGYYPKNIHLFVGEEAWLFVTTLTKNPSCLMVQEKNVFLGMSQGEMREGKVKFDEPGEYEYYCPTGNIKGTFTVMERPDEVKERIKREIAAQEEKVRIWRPRDE